jgi:phosphoribosyl 1,2-cyclic phosphodiesterase
MVHDPRQEVPGHRVSIPSPIAFRVLGSGSRGNATLLRVRVGEGRRPGHLLLDAGFSPRRTMASLAEEGLEPGDLDAIVLTHADQDHLHPGWGRVIERRGIPIFAHRRHRSRLLRHGITGRTLRLFESEAFQVPAGDDPDAPAVRLEPVMCDHDQTGTAAFLIEHDSARLGWATDLGRVPPRLLERFRDLDAVAIESNYDPGRQAASDRPDFLKRRITGGTGHLANEQALEAVRRIAAASPEGLARVVLLHLSRECNCPRLVRDLWRDRSPVLADRLVITEQDRPSAWVEVVPARRRDRTAAGPQAMLFG